MVCGGAETDNKTNLLDIIDENNGENIIVKMDIEGMEVEVIENLMDTIGYQSNVKYTVCTYHNPDDARIIKELFEKVGYKTEFSKGYMIRTNPLEYRKGIIRAY